MTLRLFFCAAVLATAIGARPSAAQQQTNNSALNGIWSLNRPLSQFPNDIGFSLDVNASQDDAQPQAAPARGGRRGGGGSRTGGTPFSGRRESYEDGQRRQLLTGEARNPPARLMIVDTGGAVVFTNELGQSRTLHPNGRQESIEIQGFVFFVTSLRDGDRLVVVYQVEQDRQVRYTYSPSAAPHRLTVDVEFLDHGMGDKVTRVYDAGDVTVAAAPPAPPGGVPPANGALPPPGAAGAPGGLVPRETFDQRPGAEFRGIKDVGVLVEDLEPEAQTCGLKHDAIEDALSKRLTAGGLNVRRNSDEDTYVYVNIITTAMPTGGCVSRYDAFLYTHATAKLAYHEQPVLVQVSLMHRGGIGASGSSSHASAVTRGLEGYVDLFVTQIRDANK